MSWYTGAILREVIMAEFSEVNFASFISGLSPCAFTCFRVLFENARDKIVKDGPQGTYEAPLDQVLKELGVEEVKALAEAIREIIQCKVDIKKGEFLYFYPFLTSVGIDAGLISYGIHRDIEGVITTITLPDKG
jgi:hypothetical protein